MKTAEQRLVEIERKRAHLLQKLKGEEARKAAKVGQYVREFMPQVERSPEFLEWLSTDIDRALFGAPAKEKKKAGGGGQKQSPGATKKVEEVQVVHSLRDPAQVVTSPVVSYAERFAQVGKKLEPIQDTGSAGDAIRRKMAGLL